MGKQWKNESALVDDMKVQVKKAHPDAWWFKVWGGGFQMAGVPDILVVVDGLLFAFEAKHQKPGESEEHARGRASAQQRDQIEKIRRAGGTAEVVLTPDEVLEHIDRRLRQQYLPW